MATKYLENVNTLHYVGASYDTILAEHMEWLDIAAKEGAYQKTDTKNQVKLSEIKLNFAKANNLFYKKKFQEALKTYQYVQGLVFQLLYPSYKPWYIYEAVHAIPVNDKLFDPILKIGGEMAVSLPPENIQTAVSYISMKSLPDDAQKYAQQYDGAGVNTVADKVSKDVRETTMLGLEFAKSGDWKQAEMFFREGLDTLGNADTPEAKIAKASLQLNLGAIHIQKGDLATARRLLTEAAEGFKGGNDVVGEGQVKLNMAAILNKEGKAGEAATLSKEASTVLHTADLSAAMLRSSPSELTAEAISTAAAATAPPGAVGAVSQPAAAAAGTVAAGGATSTSVLTGNGHKEMAATAMGSNEVKSASLHAIKLGTTIKPDTIYDLAASNGGGVVFRMPNKGDGWITQELEGNIEKEQKIAAKELGVLRGGQTMKFKWTDDKGLDLQNVKNTYYAQRVDLKDLAVVNIGYNAITDLAINLPHMYLYQLPVCMGDCHHYLGEYSKALSQYQTAAAYQYINTNIEVPALWIRVARNYLEWGNSFYKNNEVQKAFDTYVNVITADDKTPASPLYKDKLKGYGDQVSALIAAIADPDASTLNPDTVNIVLDVRNRLKMIHAGLDYFGFPANYFPIFKFDFLQSVASYFAEQAIQAEREYINFTARGEDEQMTREQLQQSVELSKAQVDLAQKQVEYAQSELDINNENAQLAALRLQNAKQQKQQYADVSYEITALEAATVFASGPEGYSVSYTYYSPSEGKDVTLSGSDAYKVMEDAAWRKGMLSREMELSNMDRNIAELDAGMQLANAQLNAAKVNVEVAVQQKKVAEMNVKHANELLDSFESQIFTPEIWFQLGARMMFISKTYLQRAIGIARKMQKAYELETGRALNTIKGDYNTNIISGLLSADYLLSDINYFTVDRINNSKSKDIPVKQMFSLAELNPTGFQTTFKNTGRLQFETSLSDFDLAYPGAYLRKIRKVEMVVEGLIPPGGVHGTLKNSGISRDRKKNGDLFFRIQPHETLYLSNYSPRTDVVIFQSDQRVLDVFENCGVATSWTLDIPMSANDLNYQTISDVKMIIYYTAQYDALLENNIRAALPKTGAKNMALPFRIVFPDEYFRFIDTGEMKFTLQATDFAYNEMKQIVKNISLKVVTEGMAASNLKFTIQQQAVNAKAVTDANGVIKSDKAVAANPLNAFIDKEVNKEWTIQLLDADNPGLDKSKIRDLFLFLEYSFTYKGL
jgi:hypothetical protein